VSTLALDTITRGSEPEAGGRSAPRRSWRLLLLSGVGVAIFMALGVWQLERRVWKLDLIDRVEQRVHAAPVAPPGPDAWAQVTAERDGYRHVALRGRFLHDHATLVRATTELGPGYWVMTPLRTDAGYVVLVNRGFVPSDRKDLAHPAGTEGDRETVVTGLLRTSEPGGRFLLHNAPQQERWYSRDVAAIAAARGVDGAGEAVAPYFIDADAASSAGTTGDASFRGDAPHGGLTVIRFANNHLTYALTWFALGLLLGGTAASFWRKERRKWPIP
jgi:surfeit locus 1 family protein